MRDYYEHLNPQGRWGLGIPSPSVTFSSRSPNTHPQRLRASSLQLTSPLSPTSQGLSKVVSP